MRIPTSRVLLAGLLLTLALGVGAVLWDVARFGTTPDATRARLQTYLQTDLTRRADELTRLTARAVPLSSRVLAATGDRDSLPQLFLDLVGATSDTHGTASLTIYSADYRTLAWSDGPAEDLPADRLRAADALFLTEGTLGLRLVHTRQLRSEDRLAGVAAAERLLSFAVGGAADTHEAYPTPYGDVMLVLPSVSSAADNLARPYSFMLTAASGAPLAEVRFDPDVIGRTRSLFRWRLAAVALLPLLITGLLLTRRLLDARREADAAAYLPWTIAATAAAAALALALGVIAKAAGMSDILRAPVWGGLALAVSAIGPLSWWWRVRPAPVAEATRRGFAVEHLASGIIAAAAITGLFWFLDARPFAASAEPWLFPVFPIHWPSVLELCGALFVTIAAVWTAMACVGTVADRWRTRDRSGRGFAAVLWLVPIGLSLTAMSALGHHVPVTGAAPVIVAVLAAGLWGHALRERYRRASPSAQLWMLFLWLALPALLTYPAMHIEAEAAARRLVESNYVIAVQRAEQPQHLQEELRAAQAEVDAFPGLADLANEAPQTPTQAAFTIWSRTRLARNRITSALELYNASGELVSRFALNVPEYGAPGLGERVSNCTWTQSGEAGRFGAEERRMLRGERALCTQDGHSRGTIVVHLMPDYRSLSFVPTNDPYFDVLRTSGSERASRLTDLQVAVYGWGALTRFTSANAAWALTPDLLERLYQSRAPFWTRLTSEGRPSDVYFANDRGGIYAVGIPVISAFEHLTRIAETLTLLAIAYVLGLLIDTAMSRFVRRRDAPLTVLIDDVRRSFYRKLFLSFVLAAVGPVVAMSLVFGTYMSGKLRADIESESSDVVTLARRVFEELLTLQQSAPTDDVLVWIGQALNQDVNLFAGSQLVATSQRDLFDSGLLPTRTPAAVYRSIALNRLPSFTVEDRLGGFAYLVAAAPVPGRGRDTILSVPLASRQRELAHELDELNRGVLVGGVLVVMLAAVLGLYMAQRIATPLARLSRATKQIAGGDLDSPLDLDLAIGARDELGRLVDDFRQMASQLRSQQNAIVKAREAAAWMDMARQVAHEVKNPLTPIQLSAEHLQRVHRDRGRPLGEVFDECMDRILAQVRLLRQISSEFSNYAASPTPAIAAVDLGALVTELSTPYDVPDHAVRVVCHVPTAPLTVWADRTLLSRAITNLIENARQAMPSGGTLTISADAASARDAVVIVADTGVGMDDMARSRAFEPYFSTKTAGSGLGLPNAKRNVELCGGSIAVESAVGRGTTITIRLQQASSGFAAG